MKQISKQNLEQIMQIMLKRFKGTINDKTMKGIELGYAQLLEELDS